LLKAKKPGIIEDIKYVEEKMTILKYIISIDDVEELRQIRQYIEKIHRELTNDDFKKWNKQFTDKQNLNEPIEEYGSTLGEFRKMIYKSEQGENYPIEEFQKKLKRLYSDS